MNNIGILGCGNIATKMAKTVNLMDGVNLYAVASRSLSKAEKFAQTYKSQKAFGSYEELLSDDAIDLVYIAVPHSHHYELIKEALNHNKNVLCEKAFTANSKMAREVLKIAEDKKLLLAEAIWTRYLPSRKIINDIIESGVLGNITSVDSNLGYNVQMNERIKEKSLAGGALLDLSVYPINFTLMFFESEIEKIESSVVLDKNSGVDGMENVSIIYENGMLATFRTSIYSNLDRRGVINGDKGYLEISNINNPEAIKLYDVNYNLVKEYEIPAQLTGFEYEVQECLDCIEKGVLEAPSMPHSEIIRVMDICDDLRKSWNYYFPFE
ncbi:MAG: Gfo/Idh/MocA family oxidoreductase [Sphaerochaetaceae bacterium]|nr:Gfo/Idh/MocA family oxidoreductase [Sphaerochaetaceae bacterium]